MEYIPWIIAGILILWFLGANLRIVPQSEAYVIEFLGKYKTTWEAGIHLKIPLLERIAKRVTLKEQVLDAPPQPVITKDNVTMQIDAVVYFRVFNPMLFTYGAINPINALDNLNATTLRNVVGELELDETLTSRDAINSKMALILDDATDPWGIKVIRVELKNIIPPKGIQESMEKQMKAERESAKPSCSPRLIRKRTSRKPKAISRRSCWKRKANAMRGSRGRKAKRAPSIWRRRRRRTACAS